MDCANTDSGLIYWRICPIFGRRDGGALQQMLLAISQLSELPEHEAVIIYGTEIVMTNSEAINILKAHIKRFSV
jgi:hypothetical protein